MKAWLSDVRHWREEHRIRIGYNGAEYAVRVAVDAIQLRAAANDGS